MANENKKRSSGKLGLTIILITLFTLILLNRLFIHATDNRIGLINLYAGKQLPLGYLCSPGNALTRELPAVSISSQRDYLRGIYDWFGGDCTQAVSIFQDSVKENNRANLATYFLALIYAQTGDFGSAHTLFSHLGNSFAVREHVTARSKHALSEEDRQMWLRIGFVADPSRVAIRRLEENVPEITTKEIFFLHEQVVQYKNLDTFDYWWSKGYLAETTGFNGTGQSAYMQAIPYVTQDNERALAVQALARVTRRMSDLYCADVFEASTEITSVHPDWNFCIQKIELEP